MYIIESEVILPLPLLHGSALTSVPPSIEFIFTSFLRSFRDSVSFSL
jgi:hypothetical protein